MRGRRQCPEPRMFAEMTKSKSAVRLSRSQTRLRDVGDRILTTYTVEYSPHLDILYIWLWRQGIKDRRISIA